VDIKAKFRAVGNFFKKPLKAVENRLDRPIEDAALGLMHDIQFATPVGASPSSDSLQNSWNIRKTGLLAWEVFSTKDPIWLRPVEFGRRAAPVPVYALVPWVQLKINPDPIAARGIAFAISRKKAHTPTPGQKFVQKTADAQLPKIGRLLRSRLEIEVLKELG